MEYFEPEAGDRPDPVQPYCHDPVESVRELLKGIMILQAVNIAVLFAIFVTQ